VRESGNFFYALALPREVGGLWWVGSGVLGGPEKAIRRDRASKELTLLYDNALMLNLLVTQVRLN
jgi:hypothetical protein